MSGIVIRNCEVLDVERSELRPGSAVRIEGERIVEVGDTDLAAPGADSWDAGGRVLMPGLIDAHVHATITTMDLSVMGSRALTLVANEARPILEGMLQRGFTTVRDAGGADRGIAEAVERGLIRGPRVFFSGRVLSQTGGHGDFRPLRDDEPLCACVIPSNGFAHVADGVPAVRKAAREELRKGARQIKIMASGGVASPRDPIDNVQYSAEEMRAIVEEAESWNTYALAHAYTPAAIQRAINAGVRTIEHGNLLDEPTARAMAEARAFLVPTLATYYMIEQFGRSFNFPEASLAKLHDVLHQGLGSLEIARRAGVRMGLGTDLLGETHPFQSREFVIRAEVLSPAEIIRSATLINAEILNQGGVLGVVAPGARADLLLVDGNPLRDISVLDGQGERIDMVMKGGVPMIDRVR